MEEINTGQRSYSARRVPVLFLLHQLLSTWGFFLATPQVLLVFVQLRSYLGIKTYMAQLHWVLYETPLFPAHVILALLVGWILGGTLRHRSMLWVWILPLVSLYTAHLGFPILAGGTSADYVLPALSSKLEYSWGQFGVHSLQEIVRISMVFTAAAYSLGALLARAAPGIPGFFRTMRILRTMRLMLLVGLPLLCLRVMLTWRELSIRYPLMRSSAGLRYYLFVESIVGVFVTFVFAIAVGLVGPRLSVTRFFLHPTDYVAGNRGQHAPGSASVKP